MKITRENMIQRRKINPEDFSSGIKLDVSFEELPQDLSGFLTCNLLTQKKELISPEYDQWFNHRRFCTLMPLDDTSKYNYLVISKDYFIIGFCDSHVCFSGLINDPQKYRFILDFYHITGENKNQVENKQREYSILEAKI